MARFVNSADLMTAIEADQRRAATALLMLSSEAAHERDRAPGCVCSPEANWLIRRCCHIHNSPGDGLGSLSEACWRPQLSRTNIEADGLRPRRHNALLSTRGSYSTSGSSSSSPPEPHPTLQRSPAPEPEPSLRQHSQLAAESLLALSTGGVEFGSHHIAEQLMPRSSEEVLASELSEAIPSQPQPQLQGTLLGVEPRQAQSQAQARQTRGMPRPRVDEYNICPDRTVSSMERFCWNIGYWLEDEIGSSLRTDYASLERLAGSLLHHAPDVAPRLASGELTHLNGASQRQIDEYRSLRARIMIGLSLVYHHNLRGSKLVRRNLTHPACRPSLEDDFKFCNIGTSQAQMIAYRTDVKRTSAVFQQCVSAGYAPNKETTGCVARAKRFSPIQEIEEMWPADARHELYCKLGAWYLSRLVPRDLRFVILDDDLRLAVSTNQVNEPDTPHVE